MDFYDALRNRRSIYQIENTELIAPNDLLDIVNNCVLHVPSAYNSQNQRVVLLFGEHNQKLWQMTEDTLKPLVPEKAFASTQKKMKSFAAGYGTVLFFEEMETVTNLQQKFELYAEQFPIWSVQANGMLQLAVWTALELEGLGASLQHYNPLIDQAVCAQWDLPTTWKLAAQMPFGKPTGEPNPKQFSPVADRVKMFT